MEGLERAGCDGVWWKGGWGRRGKKGKYIGVIWGTNGCEVGAIRSHKE